jgi:hypothetical protein
MSEHSSDGEVEELFRAAHEALRALGLHWLGTDYRDSNVFRGISTARRLMDDAEYLWRYQASDDADYAHEVLERQKCVRESYALCHASARTIGEVRVLALREIDERALDMKSFVEALKHFPERDAKYVRTASAEELIRALSWLRNPGDERVELDHAEDSGAIERAWQALVVWESTGRTPKWTQVNALLQYFGLAAESPDALRHAWATRDRKHPREGIASHHRETSKDYSPATRIGWTLKRRKE